MLQLRRYQLGSVYKAGRKVKAWYGMWREDFFDADGNATRRQRHVRLGALTDLPTKTAARQELARRIGAPSAPAVEITLSELFRRWQGIAAPTLKETTFEHYRNAIEAYVLPVFGERKVAGIERYEVELFLAEQAKKYSRNTIRSARVSLGLLLSWAVSNHWLKENACKGVKLPRPEKCAGRRVQRNVLDLKQVVAIANKLREPHSTLVLFLAVTGLRIGEAIAIKWSDFEGDVLQVQRRIYDRKVDTTKTEGSERKIPVPAALLRRMRALGGKEWVFRARGGSPLNPGNVLKRHVRPAAESLGILLGGWHDFRHSVATKMLRAGVSPKIVSELLGHADVSITLNTYDHVDLEAFRGPLDHAADQLLRDVTQSGTPEECASG